MHLLKNGRRGAVNALLWYDDWLYFACGDSRIGRINLVEPLERLFFTVLQCAFQITSEVLLTRGHDRAVTGLSQVIHVIF